MLTDDQVKVLMRVGVIAQHLESARTSEAHRRHLIHLLGEERAAPLLADLPPLPGGCKNCSGPSLWRKAKNFAAAAADHIAHGMPTVDEAEKERRLSICRGCTEYFHAESQVCTHTSCGCKMQVKAYWARQTCPIGKW